jgi:hypothetical protein
MQSGISTGRQLDSQEQQISCQAFAPFIPYSMSCSENATCSFVFEVEIRDEGDYVAPFVPK